MRKNREPLDRFSYHILYFHNRTRKVPKKYKNVKIARKTIKNTQPIFFCPTGLLHVNNF